MNYFTINQHLDNFKNFGLNHQQINSVYTGDLSRIDLDKNVKYPLLWISYIETIPITHQLQYKFRFVIADCPSDDNLNQTENIKSDTTSIGLDLLNYIKNGPFSEIYEFVSTSAIQPFEEKYPNNLTGVFFDFIFTVPFQYQACDLPINNFQIITGTTNDNVIIINREDIFTTGATLNGNTIIFNRNDILNAYNVDLSPILTGSSGFDVFVTGGTYDNSTGTALFTNNSGGTFSVSGFSTGSSGSSGFDVFVTGGTYNNSTGVAEFTNNTGGTFSVSGFSSGSSGTITGTTGSVLFIGSSGTVTEDNTNFFFNNLTDSLKIGDFVLNSNQTTITPQTIVTRYDHNDNTIWENRNALNGVSSATIIAARTLSNTYNIIATDSNYTNTYGGSEGNSAVNYLKLESSSGGKMKFAISNFTDANINEFEWISATATTGSYASGFGTTTPLMRLKGNGSLLIGSNNNNARLVVNGSGSTSSSFALRINNSTGTNNTLVVRDDTKVGIGTSTLDSTLNVQGIGTTSSSTVLKVQNSTGTNRALVVDDDGSVYMEGNTTNTLTVGQSLAGSGDMGIIKIGKNTNAPTIKSNRYGAGSNASRIIIDVSNATNSGGRLDIQLPTTGRGIEILPDDSVTNSTIIRQKSSSGRNFVIANNGQTGQLTSIATYDGSAIIDRFIIGSNSAITTTQMVSTVVGVSQSASITIEDSAVMQVDSTDKGFLPPRMTTTQRNAIVNPVAGLIIYNTTDNKHQGYDGSNWNNFY